MVTLLLDDTQAVPLGDEPVYRAGGTIGMTTSAAFGYRIGRPVALAFLDCDKTGIMEGMRVDVDIARTPFAARVSLAPAFDPSGARMRQTGPQSRATM